MESAVAVNDVFIADGCRARAERAHALQRLQRRLERRQRPFQRPKTRDLHGQRRFLARDAASCGAAVRCDQLRGEALHVDVQAGGLD